MVVLLSLLNFMKSRWDNIVAETARDSKRGGSEDQSDISVYSDLAGNIFNDASVGNDIEDNLNADSGMSVRITINEENEDEDGELEKEDADEEEGHDKKEIGYKDDDDEDDEDEDEDEDEEDDDDGDDAIENEEDEEEDEDDEEDGEDDEDDDEEDGDEEEEEDDEDDRNVSEPKAAGRAIDVMINTNRADNSKTGAEDLESGYDNPEDEYDLLEEGVLAAKEMASSQDTDTKGTERSRKLTVTSEEAKAAAAAAVAAPWALVCCRGVCQWKPHYPVFIVVITVLDWLFFLGGIIAMNPKPNITLVGPLSPSLSSFQFQTINSWPNCTNKFEHWRLISSQFTHEGLKHIGGYTALGLVYGIALESTHPYHSLLVAVVYQAAVIFGCMGHSMISPFDALIGCSSGIYGLIGCSFSHLVLNKGIMNPKYYYALVIVMAIQFLFEIVAYIIWYSPLTAYAAHFTALAVGLFMGISFGVRDSVKWKKVLGTIGLCALIVMFICLILSYAGNFPELRTTKYSEESCCKNMLSEIGTQVTIEQARLSFRCNSATVKIRR